MWSHTPSFRFEIDNFSEQEAKITSQTFVSGGCEWYLTVYPKGECLSDDHLSLFMSVANSKSLGRGWNRSIDYYFVLLTQSDKELYRSKLTLFFFVFIVQKQTEFKEKSPSWGFRKTLPLSKFQEKGFLENDKLIFEVYIQIVEASDVEGGGISAKDTVDINGFKVLASQANSVRKIFSEHPDLAEDFKLKNQVVRMEYMNVLVNLIVTLHKPSENHSESELSHARSDLCELKEAGFKLDWLQSKLDEVSLKRKKAVVDFHQLDGRVKNLDFKLDCLKTKLASLESKKTYEADGSRFQTLEERVKKLELMELDYKLDCLKTKLENVSLEKKNTDDDGSRVQQLEESVKNLKMMVSHLNVELDKKKGKTSDDGFLLVDDEVA
ncbi:PREDICTED: MATH domain and coiled-coil domain-containing protein At2g42480-like [Camelina sativa]|uniref:MATH domain and coiled-coil domain-containing protein At2g42480-like n=1 Tax=Camelina sativa TaxID=90675 RepID=A0ABM1RNX9_CAMSA|nr:PREDICTED: MATH domain and coiled-coil domain-containing protein At2g42480-like [Camelina sativa]